MIYDSNYVETIVVVNIECAKEKEKQGMLAFID